MKAHLPQPTVNLLLIVMLVVVGGCVSENSAQKKWNKEQFLDLRQQLLGGAGINALVANGESAVSGAGTVSKTPEVAEPEEKPIPAMVGQPIERPTADTGKFGKAPRELLGGGPILIVPKSIPSAERFNLLVENEEARRFFQNLVQDDKTISIVVHPDVRGEISLALKDVTVDEVVDITCEMYHFECRPFGNARDGGRGYKIFPWQLVTKTYRVDFLPVSRDGWSSTSISSGDFDANSGVAPDKRSGVSSSNIRTRYDADFWTDLENTLRSILNLDLVTTSVKDTVDRMGLQTREIEKKPFDSQYDTVVSTEADADSIQESDKKVKSFENGGGYTKYTVEGRAADDRRELDDKYGNQRQNLGKRRVRRQLKNLMVNRQSGLITVRAYPKDHRDIRGFLQHIRSRSQRQVILEAKILEVTLHDGAQLGVDWVAINRGLGSSDSAPLNSEPKDAGSFLNSLTTPVYDSAGDTVIDNVTTFSKGLLFAKAAAGVPFSLAIRTHDFVGFISLLKQQGKVQILSSPRIATLNNQKAVIKVGEDEVFITGMRQGSTYSNAVGIGGQTTAHSVPVFEKMFTGVSLDVTPQIGDSGDITLHVHPLITEVSDKVKTFNINNQSQSIPLALSQTRETDSIVRVGTGEVAIIGGLIKKNLKENKDKVPFFGDIPVLGGMFKQVTKSSVASELVILIRPMIVGQNRQWSADLTQTADRLELLESTR